MSHPAQHNGHR